MKNYLLTVIGKLESEKICKELAIGLTPIVDSPNLKFQHTSGVILFHFGSEVSKEELFDYIVGILYGISQTFILSEVNDNLTVSLPKEIKEHLMDLDKDSENVDMRIDMNEIKNGYNIFDDSQEEEDFVALLLGERLGLSKKPPLDQILDKILTKGIDSLTQHEKDTLEYYSKNY